MPKSLLPLLLAPFIFAACSTNNVTVDNNLQNYFDSAGVRGDFGLFDNGQGHFTIYNLPRFRDSVFAPGATFDIVQSLIALQTGAVANDGQMSGMGTAELARAIGKDTLKKWVDSLHYGNKDITEFTDSGQASGRLKITSDEQLGLVKKLYFDQLPFFQRPQQLAKKLFLTEGNSNYLLSYKTGKANEAGGKVVAWVMGWEEENRHPYFFVLNFESTNPQMDMSAVGLQLVKKILGPMGFFAGKK